VADQINAGHPSSTFTQPFWAGLLSWRSIIAQAADQVNPNSEGGMRNSEFQTGRPKKCTEGFIPNSAFTGMTFIFPDVIIFYHSDSAIFNLDGGGIMFKKILVPLDGSKLAEKILPG